MSGRSIPALFLAACVLIPAVLQAQQSASTVPIPAPLLSAQKVFLANGGADSVSADAFSKAGLKNEPYTSFYSALHSWGRWQLLSSPGTADLVLIIDSSAPPENYSSGMPVSYAPQLKLTILDGKTHFPLWTASQPIAGAFRKATFEKNYGDSIAGLIDQLKTLTSPSPQTP